MNTQILMVLDVLAKSLGVLLFAAALQSLWRRTSAAQRCLVWLAAFSVLLLLPLTAIMKPVWTVKVPDRAPPPRVLHELPVIQSMPMIPDDNMVPLPVAEPAWQMPQLGLWQWLGLAWLAGVCVLLLRRVAGAWQLRRLYKESFACETPRISALASRLASEVGVRRRVDLRLSSQVTVPLTWGFFKPVLLLPADAFEWQEAPLHAALCHELGHIRHWDALSRLLMTVLCALQWPNALLWFAAKSWRTAQEQACDDLVLNSGASKEAYAMQLLESARSVQRLGFLHAALTMAQPSTLETRLSAIMDLKRDRRPMRRSALIAGLASAFSLLMVCAALQLRAESSLRITMDVANLKLVCDDLQFSDLQHQIGKATGHVTLTVTNDGPPPSFREGKADEVEFDLGKKQAVLRGHPETLVPGRHRHYGMADDTKMILHWDGDKVRQETFGAAKTDILAEATGKGEPLKGAARVESPFKNVDITGEQTNFDPATGIATAKGHVEMKVATNGNPPAIYRGKADALEYDSNKKVAVLHGHAEIADSATGEFLSFDDKDVIIKWDTPAGSWEVRAVKKTAATSSEGEKQAKALAEKMQRIIFPTVQFKEATLEEAIEFLRVKSKDLDTAETRAAFKGVNVILMLGGPPPTDLRISLDLQNVPMAEALRYVTELANVRYKVESYGVVVGDEKRLARLGTGTGVLFDGFIDYGKPITTAAADASGKTTVHGPVLVMTDDIVTDESVIVFPGTAKDAKKSAAQVKADGIIIPTVAFKEATVDKALEFFRVQAKKLDPEGKGVNILLKVGPQSPSRAAQITMDLRQIPLSEALRYVAGLANLEIKAEGGAVILQELGKRDTAGGAPTSNAFSVVGEVVRQGIFELKPNERIMLSEAIERAGGPTAFADMKNVHLVRKTATGETKAIDLNRQDPVPLGQFGFEILIGAGDTIKVDKQGENPRSLENQGQFRQHPANPLLAMESNGSTLNFTAATVLNVASDATAKSAAQTKADHLIIPDVLFKEVTVDEALEFIRVKAKELDPEGKGVNILLKAGPESMARDARLTMDLHTIPVSEVLRYVAGLANLEIKVDDKAFILQEPGKKDVPTLVAGTLEVQGGTLVLDHATAPSPVLTKANQIIFPSVVFQGSTVEEVVDFLRLKSKELDPAKKGVNIVLKVGPQSPARTARFGLDLKNVPLSEALRYAAELAGLEIKAEGDALTLQEPEKKGADASKAAGNLVFDKMATRPAPQTSSGNEAGDRYFQGYLRMEEGQRLERSGDVAEARKKYQEAQQIFAAVAHDYSAWQPDVMPHRQKEIEDSLQRLDSKAVASAPTLTQPRQLIFPTVSFNEATVEEALDFLRVKSKELDPAHEGVNIVLKAGPKAKAQVAKLTMDLKEVPLTEALHYVAELADLDLVAEDHAMILRERSKSGPAAEQKGNAAAPVPAKGLFTVFGQVKQQGKFELQPGEKLTLSQSLQRAGGPTAFAKTRKIHVVRKTPEGNKTINVNYDNVMKGVKTEQDIQIEPNDVIIVDEKVISF